MSDQEVLKTSPSCFHTLICLSLKGVMKDDLKSLSVFAMEILLCKREQGVAKIYRHVNNVISMVILYRNKSLKESGCISRFLHTLDLYNRVFPYYQGFQVKLLSKLKILNNPKTP